MKKLLNPFLYIAGGRSLLLGAAGLCAAALIASCTGQAFDGLLHIGYAPTALWQAAAQQAVMWFVPALLLWAASLLLSKSRVRAIDIFGTALFARLPIVLLLALDWLPGMEAMRTLSPEMPAEAIAAAITPGVMLYGVLAIVILVWFFVWSYRAYAVSANLKGWRAVASFAGCYLIAAFASAPLLTALLVR